MMSDELSKFHDAGIDRNRQKSKGDQQHTNDQHRQANPQGGNTIATRPAWSSCRSMAAESFRGNQI